MTDDELVYIEAAAAAAGLSVPSYLVAAASPDQSRPGWSVAQREALVAEILGASRVLRRAGENLNRLTKIAHGQGQVPPEVPAASAAVREYAERFEQVVTALDPRRSGQGGGPL